ncbi:MAG: DUF1559 domain-containing protein [Fuerstiella sp.]|nr:DUF1559 domain-containing protein [Fuerstiella sp.]MCP4853576.1 DUF1559 domain-containing protein [Fuerstiella sp.]
MKEPAAGKKLRCPGCKEAFVAAGKSGGGKKKRRPPADDFDDYGADDDFSADGDDDEFGAPARPRKSAGKGKKGKKAPAKTKSKTPLIAGIAILGLGLVGALVYMLVFANGGDATADNDSSAAGEVAADAGAEDEDGEETEATAETSTKAGSSGGPAAVAGASSTSQDGSVNLAWLPPTSEAVVRIDIARLVDGPLGQLLQNPMLSPQIEQFKQQVGFGPEDVESITVGVGGISDAVSRDTPPQPEDLPVTAVVRARTSVDIDSLQSVIPNSQSVTDGQMTYLRVRETPPVAIWLADSTTAVVGVEDIVKRAASFTTPPSGIDTALFDGEAAIQVVFSPSNPDAIFRHPQAVIPPVGPPAGLELAKHFLATADAASLGIDLTDDLGFSMAARCRDAAAAQQMVKLLNASSEESKAQAEAQMAGLPPMLAPLMTLNKTLTDSQKIAAEGDICKMTMSAPGGGQQIAGFIPMIPMMIGPMMQQAQSAAQAVQPRNNLKNMALAMHNFSAVYGRFPNSVSRSESGDALLSWRVHLLPFLGHEELYNQFALDEPWDSTTNQPLAEQMPDVFRTDSPGLQPGHTVYQLPVGPGAAFEDTKGLRMGDFTDGTSNTILIVEVPASQAVFWTQPGDFAFDPDSLLDGMGETDAEGFPAALVDGQVTVITETGAALKALFTRNGGEAVNR